MKRSTNSGAFRPTRMRPSRRCSTSSSRGSTTCRKARSATSACAATRRWPRRSARRAITPLWKLPEAAREGITCVACHRVQYAYGKSNGERRIETGDIFAPVFGGIGGDGVAEAIAQKDQFKVKTSPERKGPGPKHSHRGHLLPAPHAQRVLHAVPSGGRVPGHQARSRVGAVPRVAGVQEGHSMPGLPHGPRARLAGRLRVRRRRQSRAAKRSTTTARSRITFSTARTTRSPTPACSRST